MCEILLNSNYLMHLIICDDVHEIITNLKYSIYGMTGQNLWWETNQYSKNWKPKPETFGLFLGTYVRQMLMLQLEYL